MHNSSTDPPIDFVWRKIDLRKQHTANGKTDERFDIAHCNSNKSAVDAETGRVDRHLQNALGSDFACDDWRFLQRSLGPPFSLPTRWHVVFVSEVFCTAEPAESQIQLANRFQLQGYG